MGRQVSKSTDSRHSIFAHQTSICSNETTKQGRTMLSQRLPRARRLATSASISSCGSDDSVVSKLLVSTLDSLEFIRYRSSSDIWCSVTSSSNPLCDGGFKFCQLGSDLSPEQHTSHTNYQSISLQTTILVLGNTGTSDVKKQQLSCQRLSYHEVGKPQESPNCFNKYWCWYQTKV